MPKANVSEVAKVLKRLRMKAGISMSAMARELGMKSGSKYQHYEDRYKKEHLPPDIAAKVAAILRRAGISDEELAELGAAAVVHEDKLDMLLEEVRRLSEKVDALQRKEPAG